MHMAANEIEQASTDSLYITGVAFGDNKYTDSIMCKEIVFRIDQLSNEHSVKYLREQFLCM